MIWFYHQVSYLIQPQLSFHIRIDTSTLHAYDVLLGHYNIRRLAFRIVVPLNLFSLIITIHSVKQVARFELVPSDWKSDMLPITPHLHPGRFALRHAARRNAQRRFSAAFWDAHRQLSHNTIWCRIWWSVRVLPPQPSACKADALLLRQRPIYVFQMRCDMCSGLITSRTAKASVVHHPLTMSPCIWHCHSL